MASRVVKGIEIELGSDATKLGKALKDIESKSNVLQSQLKQVNKLLKFDPSNTEILNQKQDILAESIKETSDKLAVLQEAEKQVQKQFAEGKISQEQYRELQVEILKTKDNLKYLQKQQEQMNKTFAQSLEEVGKKLSNTGDSIEKIGKKTAIFSAAATTALVSSAKSAIDFESAFTGVEKTVDATSKELSDLKKGIREMAKELPSSTTEISAVAEAAGQLGIKTEDILSFTKVMINLGNSTNLSAEEAASSLAKFANITNMSAKDYDRLGSTIVALGNNFATTEADIVQMATRLAATGELTGLTQSQILSLATAMSSVGIEAEAGGTAMSKLLKKMQVAVETGSGNLENFAKIAGMTSSQFKKSFEEDAVKALSAFIGGLNDTKRNGKSAIAILQDMDLSEVRLSNTILSLANASDLMNDAVDLGNNAWKQNVALTNEANKRYSTTSSKMQMTVNRIKDLQITIGNKLLPVVEKGLNAINKFIDNFNELDDSTKNIIITIAKLVAAISPVMLITGKVVGGIGDTINAFSKLSKATEAATGSQLAHNAAILANPYVLGAVGITALVAGIIAFAKAQDDATLKNNEYATSLVDIIERQKEFEDSLKDTITTRDEAIKNVEVEVGAAEKLLNKLTELEAVENKTNGQKEQMAALVQQLNELMPDLNLEYDKEKDALNQSTDAIKNHIIAQKELMKAKVAQESLTDIAKQMVEQEMLLAETTEENTKLEKQYQEAKKKTAELLKQWESFSYYEQNNDERAKKIHDQLKQAREAERDLKEAYEESNKVLNEQQNSLNKINAEYDKTKNYADNMFNQAELVEKISNLTDLAAQAGVDIPDKLVHSLQENKYKIPESIAELNDLIKFDDALTKAQKAGADVPDAIVKGLNAGEYNITEANNRLNRWINFQEALAKSDKAGIEIPEKIKNGILSGELSVSDAMKELDNIISTEGNKIPKDMEKIGNDANEKFSTTIKNYKGYYEAGKFVVEGTEKGIKDKKATSSAYSAVQNFASNILSKLKSSLKEKSPSKATEEMGINIDEGIIVGVKNNEKNVLNKIKKFGESTLDALKNSLDDDITLNTDFNGTRNIMMKTFTDSNSKVADNRTAEDLKTLTSLLNKYMPIIAQNAGHEIVLDGKKVGKTIAPTINKELGTIASKEQRGY